MCPMYSPLPLGKAEPKVKVSDGPSSDIFNFYHTRYSSDYVRSSVPEVKPKRVLHKGTGYGSNIRPVVSYSAAVDKEVNPYMFDVNKAMYNTITKLDYVKYGPASCDKFPGQTVSGDSGFVRDVKYHIPTAMEMNKLWHSSPKCDDCPQMYRPLLYKIHHSKSAIPQCYGDTEYRVRHKGEQLSSDMTLLDTKSIGCLEPSGHVLNKNIEPITYKPSEIYLHPQPNMRSHSIYQTSFQPFATGTGLETLPALANRSDYNTGNTRENMDTNPPFITKNPKSFVKPQHQMPGDSSDPRHVKEKLGEFKEESGAVLNRTNHISLDPTLASRHPWQTHYAAVHTDPSWKGKDREGHCRGGVQKQWDDGFTRSTKWTKFPPEEHPADTLKRVHPTVARSILVENPNYGHPLYQKPDEVPVC